MSLLTAKLQGEHSASLLIAMEIIFPKKNALEMIFSLKMNWPMIFTIKMHWKWFLQ